MQQQAPPQPPPPKVMPDMRIGDNFKIVKKVGSGAFGEIFKGRDIDFNTF